MPPDEVTPTNGSESTVSYPISALTIVLATPEQVFESHRRTYDGWELGQESIEEHLGRRANIARFLSSFNEPGKHAVWVLVPRDDPRTLDFCCACETHRRTAIAHTKVVSQSRSNDRKNTIDSASLSTPSPPSLSIGVEDVTAYGIGAVFTPKRFRGKGYASHMMRLLHHVLAPPSSLEFPAAEWGTPPVIPPGFGNARISYLYSDVGTSFYASCGPGVEKCGGWVVSSPKIVVWEVSTLEGALDGIQSSKPDVPEGPSVGRRWLDENALRYVLDQDANNFRNDLIRLRQNPQQVEATTTGLALSPPRDAPHDPLGGNAVPPVREQSMGEARTRFALLPNSGNVDFLIRRCLFNLPPRMRGRGLSPESKWGAQLASASSGRGGKDTLDAFVAWVIESHEAPDRVLITRLRCPHSHLLSNLLSAAVEAAIEYGMTHIEVWNLPKDLRDAAVASGLGGVESERNDHLSAVKWYGDHSEDQVEWIMNEKYSWC
ncbi:hypothetical protein BOTBODRAFT_185844 [Botryobasidium botryosum FD-172 SS1]|uniref:LYC1 C-terminal domain-containing protein n=1 Tax=Botryobasidium botryosum (strain FD-172 SS1) TaxID=930990 RepID=A0A067MPT7_BOTB1|nr:hypothetical protein BOTBODRAFT_185844 [Botryobasidium botryosum FD-172 SS1]